MPESASFRGLGSLCGFECLRDYGTPPRHAKIACALTGRESYLKGQGRVNCTCSDKLLERQLHSHLLYILFARDRLAVWEPREGTARMSC